MTTMTAATAPASDLQVGDFVDRTHTFTATGRRGGRYIQRAVRVESTITHITGIWGRAGVTGLQITTHAGTFTVAEQQLVDFRR